MVEYVQCKFCYDEDTTCTHCDGSGYVEKRSIKEIIKNKLSCIFPCLNEKENVFEYGKISKESEFYDDLFNMMNDMETTSLISHDTSSDEDSLDLTVKKIEIPSNSNSSYKYC
jgi:hypothetical protein